MSESDRSTSNTQKRIQSETIHGEYTVSSFNDEDAFELEDAFNEEVMIRNISSHHEREYKKLL